MWSFHINSSWEQIQWSSYVTTNCTNEDNVAKGWHRSTMQFTFKNILLFEKETLRMVSSAKRQTRWTNLCKMPSQSENMGNLFNNLGHKFDTIYEYDFEGKAWSQLHHGKEFTFVSVDNDLTSVGDGGFWQIQRKFTQKMDWEITTNEQQVCTTIYTRWHLIVIPTSVGFNEGN